MPLGIEEIFWPLGSVTLEKLDHLIGEYGIDMIHVGPLHTCAYMVSQLSRKIPMVSMSWGYDVLSVNEKDKLKQSIESSDYVICDCQTVRNRIHKLAKIDDEKIVSFPWGVDLDLFCSRDSKLTLRKELAWEDKVVFLSTRSWEEIYGIDILIKAFSRACKSQANIRLLLLGGGSLENEIKDLIHQEGIESKVHIYGRVENEGLVEFYNTSDIYVSTAYVDGSSISLLEAMACSLPVILTNNPSNREWIKDAEDGFLFNGGDPIHLAEYMLKAIGRVDEMGHRARRIVEERAAWSKNIQLLLNVYDHVEDSCST